MADELIVGATASTYTLTATDVGRNIYCRVTGTNAFPPPDSADSNIVGPVTAAAVASPPTTNLYFWLDAGAGTLQTSGGSAATANGDPVGQWQDQSGNGRHWSQSTSGARPTLQTSVVNSKPVLRFVHASGQYLNGPDMSALTGTSTGGEIFIVVKTPTYPPGGNEGAMWTLGQCAEEEFYSYSDGNLYEGFGILANRQNGISPGVSLASQFRLYNVAISVGPGFDMYLDGTLIYSYPTPSGITTAVIAFSATPTLGKTMATNTFSGDIAEVIMYSARCSTPDRAALHAYIETKYALTIA